MRTNKPLASAPVGASRPEPPAIVVKTLTVDVLMKTIGWSPAELSRRARLDQSAVARLLKGDLRPGPRSIAGLLVAFTTAFPKIGFYDLFQIVDADGSHVAPEVEEDDDTAAATA